MDNVVVQVSGRLPSHPLDRDVRVRRQTVLWATVTDQAGLYGLLRVLPALGLDLVDLHQLAQTPDPVTVTGGEVGPFPDPEHPLSIEVVVDGAVGDLTLSALGDHVDVTDVATRLLLADRQLLGESLERALVAGLAVEFAADASAASGPQRNGEAARHRGRATHPQQVRQIPSGGRTLEAHPGTDGPFERRPGGDQP